jgi:hypothetical protein
VDDVQEEDWGEGGRQRQLGASATASASMGVVQPARKHERVKPFNSTPGPLPCQKRPAEWPWRALKCFNQT